MLIDTNKKFVYNHYTTQCCMMKRNFKKKEADNMKEIIIYYSRSGNTERIAKKIQADIQCDILKVEPEEAYGNYIMSCLRVMKEKKQEEPPKFITEVPDLTSFHIIFLGYPVWAQNVPVFVQEFIKKCDIKGKIVIPFATYGMSGINWTMKTLRNICVNAEIKLPFDNGLLKKGDYDKWINDVKKLITQNPS